MQIIALENAGCEKIYEEIISEAKADRPILQSLLNKLRPGDMLVVWRLDRLGGSLKNLVDFVQKLIHNEIGLCSLHNPLDITNSQSRLIFIIFAPLAEFERDVIRERTQAGLSATRAPGTFRWKAS